MKILEELKKRADLEKSDDPASINSKLFVLAKEIKDKIEHHLKQITSQMKEFDIHDSSHSEKIISNIESLLGDKIISLSNFDLLLIYLSCYLHDSAMALPEWELRLLKLTEGTELLDVPEFTDNLKRDMKHPCTHTEALFEIEKRKQHLYIEYNKINDFIFLTSPESEFKSDLCSRLIEYQEFRNGYSSEMKKNVDEGNKSSYCDLSNFIRQEFVRSTHAQRVEKYIQNLAPKFEERLGGKWGSSLVYDLAKICRSHGEDFEFVQTLETQASYFGKENANLQFVSIMLRLGDILHFSFDRVSKSLLAEKMIDSITSLKHWKAKFQGLNYSLDETDNDGKIKIKYMAFCDNPESFYFIQEYMNFIDDEISNYFKFIGSLDYFDRTKHLVPKYRLAMPEKVDRTQIRHDENKFTPVLNLGFTLDQKRILELLMGVGLYKNKYYSLREVYQNSLDACRCMIATYLNDGIKVKGKIEFGLKKETIDGKQLTFLYCLDNGIGMNKKIVQEFFLRVGNSYYNSREYKRRASKLKNSFQPVSQFGIGILSCFMIADRIEITSISLDENRNSGEPIRFAIDGPHERFYYIKPDSFDLEQIGTNGTLIKLFLKTEEESSLNTTFIENPFVMIYGADDQQFVKDHEKLYSTWKGNIFNLLNSMIGIVEENVGLTVRFKYDKIVELLPYSTTLDIHTTVFDEIIIKELYQHRAFWSDNYKPFEDFLNCKDFIEPIPLKVCYEGIEFYTLICLPKQNIPVTDKRVLSFMHMLREEKVLIDGIVTNGLRTFIGSEFEHELIIQAIINFGGIERPRLSVDRETITGLSDRLKVLLKKLNNLIATAIVDVIEKHFETYHIDKKSEISLMIWDYIFSKFYPIRSKLLQILLADSNKIEIPALDIEQCMDHEITLREIAKSKSIKLNYFDYRRIGHTSKIVLLNKLAKADKIKVQDSSIELVSSQTSNLISLNLMENPYSETVILADEWVGKFSEYDLVTSLWPIVPPRLYRRIIGANNNKIIESTRMKQIHRSSNTLSGIFELESVSVHEKLGLFKFEKRFGVGRVNRVGKFGHVINNFWFPEFKEYNIKKSSKAYVVYTYISPSNLTDEEKISLETYKENDPVYYEGVIQGLSVLFLPDKHGGYVMKTGVVERSQMVKLIKDSFWDKNKEIEFIFLDDKALR